ncbi:MAG: glycosyltransferase family 39 protein [Candidatus Thermoplasmatota archaeon]|nr:glycosyltransferase family 39 protein [Candidatus Thermoplasmatota archaeon]
MHRPVTRTAIAFLLLMALAVVLRLYNIAYPFSLNGIDEGVHLMAAKLAAQGFDMYTQINVVQAPFFLYVYSLFQGNVVACRLLSAFFSLLGVAGVYLFTRRVADSQAAMVAGAFMACNYLVVKESRIASMDLFASVLLIFAFYFLLVALQRQTGRTVFLSLSGVLFAMSALTKLFAFIPLACVSLYLFVLWLHRHGYGRERRHLLFLSAFFLAALGGGLTILSIYGLETTFTGMVLNNLYRPEQSLGDKIRQVATFGALMSVPLAFSLYAIRKRYRWRETHLLLIWLLPLLVFFLVQSLTWMHHYILIVPPVCILGALGLHEVFTSSDPASGPRFSPGLWTGRLRAAQHSARSRVAAVLVTVIFIGGMVVSGSVAVFTTEEPVAYQVAEDVRQLTTETEWVISGDPTVLLYADRLQVPEITNLAMVKYPQITSAVLVNLTERYNVSTVVVTYNLSTHSGYLDYLGQHFQFHRAYDQEGNVSTVPGIIPVSTDTYVLYHRNQSPPDIYL